MCDSMGTNGLRHGLGGDSTLVTCTDAGGGSWALDVVVKNFPAGGSQVEVTNFPSSQAVTGTFWPATQPVSLSGSVAVTGTFWQATQPVSGTVAVSNLPASQAVTGTFWQATQPVSGTVAVSNLPATQAVSGTFWQTTQPVSGTFWQATQPVSAASLPLPTGAATETTLAAMNTKVPTVAQKTMANSLPVVIASDQSAVPTSNVVLASCPLFVTATAAVNTALTTTLPAAGSGLFHYITNIQVTKLYSVIGVAAGAGVIVTTTNLPGSPAFTTEQLASAAGTAATVVNMNFCGNPLKSSAANTATTIVCPQQLQTIWRVNVSYYTGT